MNIFALSDDPVIAAQVQHDKHVVKMTLETAQLLSAAIKLRHEWRFKVPLSLTPFAMAMPQEFKTDDPVLSYRLYYLSEKIYDDSQWTRRDRVDLPLWLRNAALFVKG